MIVGFLTAGFTIAQLRVLMGKYDAFGIKRSLMAPLVIIMISTLVWVTLFIIDAVIPELLVAPKAAVPEHVNYEVIKIDNMWSYWVPLTYVVAEVVVRIRIASELARSRRRKKSKIVPRAGSIRSRTLIPISTRKSFNESQLENFFYRNHVMMIILSATCHDAFVDYACKEFVVENVRFIEEANDVLRRLDSIDEDPMSIRVHITMIAKTFVQQGSQFEINVSAQERDAFLKVQRKFDAVPIAVHVLAATAAASKSAAKGNESRVSEASIESSGSDLPISDEVQELRNLTVELKNQLRALIDKCLLLLQPTLQRFLLTNEYVALEQEYQAENYSKFVIIKYGNSQNNEIETAKPISNFPVRLENETLA